MEDLGKETGLYLNPDPATHCALSTLGPEFLLCRMGM